MPCARSSCTPRRIADAVLEGKSSVPQVAVGEDEFVELDEEGNPRRTRGTPGAPQAGRGRAPQDPAAPPSRGAAAGRPPRRRRRPEEVGASSAELDDVADTAEVAERLGTPRPRRLKRRRGAGTQCAAPLRGGTTRAMSRVMSVTAEAVRQLRERTGAGMMECKRALVETGGDLDAAAELMRKQGLAKADKKAARVAAEGVIVIERSADGTPRPWSRSTARPISSRASRTSAASRPTWRA